MSDRRHVRARAIFLGACERPQDERQDYLSEECGDDAELRRELNTLLEFHEEAGGNAAGAPDDTPRRFRSGELFANRYRIVALLGEGGTGQVYRAEDETIGVPVAVKVLPRHATGREQLLTEVRHAREVTHPAICRVHDAGEWKGELFITMEYVAGEDLASLLRRIGRMPPDKVLDIACQLCAGLVAAHARGVLQRDLKPGNVLIDPDGRVRIADFGVAVGQRESAGAASLAGTPAYMAPELLLPGRGATERSDLYSLGLVLYELATGRLPFDVGGLAARGRPPGRWTPDPPSRFVSGLDPALEQAILTCLSPDPAGRPDSALALAASLPGTDPLLLAADVRMTPSPAIVAAAGGEPAISPGILWAAFGGLLLLLGAALVLGEEVSVLEPAGAVKPPEVLVDRAREMVGALGYSQGPAAPRYGYLDGPAGSDREASVLFWYRQESERALAEATRSYLYASPLAPAPVVAGHLVALLDQAGWLVYFQAEPVPPSEAAIEGVAGEVDWRSALAFTGLQTEQRVRVPAGPSPVFADSRVAWMGDGAEGRTTRVDGAASGGRIVYLAVSHPVERGAEIANERAEFGARSLWFGLFVLVVVAAALPLAHLNLRRNRGDRRGARRLVIFVLGRLFASWVLRLGWIPHPMHDTASLVAQRLGTLLLHGIWLWAGYLALEPYVRRTWPRVLVAWSRALEGRVRDPLVGQSVLLGTVAGAALLVVELLSRWQGLDVPAAPAASSWLQNALSTPLLFATALATIPRAIYDGLVTVLILVLLRGLRRGSRLGTAAFVIVYALLVVATGGGDLAVSWLGLGLPVAAIAAFVLVRFGLLAYVAARFVVYLLGAYALTTDLDLWYSRGPVFATGLVAVIAGLALWVALGGPAARRHRTATSAA